MATTPQVRQAFSDARDYAETVARICAVKLIEARAWMRERAPRVRRRARWLRLRAQAAIAARARPLQRRAQAAIAGREREEVAAIAAAIAAALLACLAGVYAGSMAYLSSQAADRAQAYARAGDQPATIEALDDALYYWPGEVALLRQRGRAHWETGALAAADADFSQALAREAHDVQLWYERATVRRELGRPAAAIEDYTQVLALAPDTVEAHFGRAQALLATGAAERAVADCDAALLLGSYLEPELLVLRAQAQRTLGDLRAALADAGRARALRPDHQEANQLLDELRSLD